MALRAAAPPARSSATGPDLGRYLERIEYAGPLAPSLEALAALQRAHLQAIPYENLDIHLGRPLELGAEAAFARLVAGRRGGWCYEMNGLFAWALGRLGFRVRLVSGAVGRERIGAAAQDNHLVTLVELDRWYLADVGFGDGPLDPLPLVEGTYRQDGLEFGLTAAGDRWVFRNHRFGGAPSFDFSLEPRDIGSFRAKCRELQTSPDSGFVQKTVCQRYVGRDIVTLRGAVLRTVSGSGTLTERVVESGGEWVAVLRDTFGLEIPEAAGLWGRVWDAHLRWLESGTGGLPRPNA